MTFKSIILSNPFHKCNPFSNRLKILKKNVEPPITTYHHDEPPGIHVHKLWERRNAENTKVFWNNSDNNIVAEQNYGLKGGGVRTSRPDTATTNEEFSVT
jgi:hypothetical protein